MGELTLSQIAYDEAKAVYAAAQITLSACEQDLKLCHDNITTSQVDVENINEEIELVSRGAVTYPG